MTHRQGRTHDDLILTRQHQEKDSHPDPAACASCRLTPSSPPLEQHSNHDASHRQNNPCNADGKVLCQSIRGPKDWHREVWWRTSAGMSDPLFRQLPPTLTDMTTGLDLIPQWKCLGILV